MPIYWGDYLRDTAHLSTAEHGAYMLLLAHYWTTGKPIPSDDERLRRITRMDKREWMQSRSALTAFFTVDGDTLRHKRVDEEILRAKERTEKRSKAGAAGAKGRWQTHGKGNAEAMANDMRSEWQNDGPSPSPSHESSNEDSPPVVPQPAKEKIDARGTRLSADWQPDEQLQAFAHGLGLDVGRVAEDFRDYWHGKAGSAARKADWAATWRKWCRRASDDVQRPSPARTGPRGGIGSNMLEAGALAAERLRADQARRSGRLGGFEGGDETPESGTLVGPDNRVPLALVRG
jgi:uncharacterized protein YdaU (DUF1376 family)